MNGTVNEYGCGLCSFRNLNRCVDQMILLACLGMTRTLPIGLLLLHVAEKRTCSGLKPYNQNLILLTK
jgi:hypothetical protein